MLQRFVQIRLPVAVFAILVFVGCAREPEERVLNDTAHTVILPLYQQFALQTNTLEEASDSFCATDGKTKELLGSLHYTWREAMKSWSAVEIIQFGPITQDERASKIEFWPDREDRVAREVDKLLESDKALTQSSISEADIAVQGLSAMEYLLFQNENEEDSLSRFDADTKQGERRCELLRVIAGNTRSIAGDILHAWESEGGNFIETFTSPGNEEFPNEKAALSALVTSIVSGIERIQQNKLEGPLNLSSGGDPDPRLLEWSRSRSAREAIAANLTNLQKLYTAGNGFGLDNYLLEQPEGKELSRAIQERIALAQKHVASTTQPLFNVGDNVEQREQLEQASTILSELLKLLREDLTATLDISLRESDK